MQPFILHRRLYQFVLRAASYGVAWPEPRLLEGPGALGRLPTELVALGMERMLLVTDRGLVAAGMAGRLAADCAAVGLGLAVYDGTVPNPTTANVEEALRLYRGSGAQGIIALGGGSAIDCAKCVGARVARPDRSPQAMRGLLKVDRRLPPLVAVPTTAGTGSEATIAAVISDAATHEKIVITDHALVPALAVLDPELTAGLPPALTAATGMDALTHAVEAYIGRSNTRRTRAQAREAVALIFRHLPAAHADGADLGARAAVQRAAYLAGLAFTRAYVGYVHALAHSLGGAYGIPHGLANAVLLAPVLKAYGPAAERRLAELADLVGLGGPGLPPAERAARFIAAVEELNRRMGVPARLPGIAEADLPVLVERAAAEAHPLYPVPAFLSHAELQAVCLGIK